MKEQWLAWIKNATQLVAAAMLLLGGVVYTIMLDPRPFPKVGVVGELPGMVIRAPTVSEEAFRVATILKRYTKDTKTADRIAAAIVEQGRRRNLDPALLLGVLLTEDVTLDTMARSVVGASGLMQVMPFHSGKWGCGSKNLFSVESNICHGASILEDAVRYAPNIRVALLRYNGCVRGTVTKNCHTYPDRVMRIANRATAQMLAMAPIEPIDPTLDQPIQLSSVASAQD
jgi:hypothetical protein